MECPPARAHRTFRCRHSHRRHRARARSGRLAAADQARNGAGRDLPRGHPRRKLGCGRVRWVGNGGAFAPLTLAISTSRRLPWRWRRRGCASTRLHGRRGACLRATWPNGRSATSLGRFVRLCLQFWIELLSRSICMIRFWPSADTALKRRGPNVIQDLSGPSRRKAIPVTSGQNLFPVELHRIRQNSCRH